MTKAAERAILPAYARHPKFIFVICRMTTAPRTDAPDVSGYVGHINTRRRCPATYRRKASDDYVGISLGMPSRISSALRSRV
jgi:hypothetical protein